jgi:hypothetical protein
MVNILMGKKCLKSMHYCYLITEKKRGGAKKKQRKWTFELGNFCHFLVHLTIHLPYRPITFNVFLIIIN